MTDLALNMHFEEAQKKRENWNFGELPVPFYDCQPENYQYRCLSIVSDESAAYVNFLQISTVPSFDPTLWKSKKARRNRWGIIRTSWIQRAFSITREIIVPFHVDLCENIKSRFLNWETKKQILDLSVRNAKFRIEQLKQLQIVDPDRHTKRLHKCKRLAFARRARHIECFDNSNIQEPTCGLCGI
jgi:excinuclease ABC subunit C